MEVDIEIVGSDRNEYVKIGCHKVDERVKDIERYVKLRQGSIEGIREGRQYTVPVSDILYAESVDERSFIYLKDECFESKKKLYELEEMLKPYHFTRISKSAVVNLLKIVSIKPALNGRFLCLMDNDEEVIISRKYVPEIKKKLRGEA